MTYILFIIGFFLLTRGANLLIDGSSSLAKRFGVSDMIIGLTVVAFGTSLPEMVVNVISSLKGSSDLVLGNIIGSNISNMLLILGFGALIYPIKVRKLSVWREMKISIIAVLLLLFFMSDKVFFGKKIDLISHFDGVVLLFLFLLFLYFIFAALKSGADIVEHEEIHFYKPSKAVFMVILGILGLYLGGEWIVNGALLIADRFGVSQGFIGLTILAIGTSLPELAASFAALSKQSSDMAFGNVIGSNIFNILFVLGLSALINPIKFDPELKTDAVFMFLITLFLFLRVYLKDHHQISRKNGLLFVLIYFVYLVYLFFRG